MKQKDDFLKKVIITIGIFLFCFTVAIFIVFCVTGGSEPSTLIACVFTACLGECSICGLIKTNKNKEVSYKEFQPSEESEEDIDIAG